MQQKFLYHGSSEGIEGALLPRQQHGDANGLFPDGEQKLVFATDDKSLAALYTLKNEEMLSAGRYKDTNFGIFRDYDSWKKKVDSAQSTLYTLPSESFTNTIDSKTGNPTKEWKSRESVMPVEITRCSPETVMETGTQLFFLDKNITKEMWSYDPKKNANASFMNRLTEKYNNGLIPQSFSPLHIIKELLDNGMAKHMNLESSKNAIHIEKHPDSHLIQDDIEWLKSRLSENLLTKKSWVERVEHGVDDKLNWLKDLIANKCTAKNPSKKEL